MIIITELHIHALIGHFTKVLISYVAKLCGIEKNKLFLNLDRTAVRDHGKLHTIGRRTYATSRCKPLRNTVI